MNPLNAYSAQYDPHVSVTSELMYLMCFSSYAQDKVGFEDRLSVEGSLVFLDQVKSTDAGQFKIIDTQGFNVSTIHLGVQCKQGKGQPDWKADG